MKPGITKLGFVRSGALIAVLCIMTMHSTFAEIPLAERRSGYDLLSRETRAMQDDDTANPGMLWVLDGEALWRAKAGTAEKACADCHGDARETMKGVAARYPAFDPARGQPVNLEQRINICRSEQQKAQPFAYESKELLALTAYVARQSRGMPIEGAADERLKPFVDTGRALFTRRLGQLNLTCAQCHDDNWGQKARRQPAAAGASDRLPALPARMADGRLAAAPPAQLPDRHARGALCVRLAGIRRARDFPDVARARTAGRDASGAPVSRVCVPNIRFPAHERK